MYKTSIQTTTNIIIACSLWALCRRSRRSISRVFRKFSCLQKIAVVNIVVHTWQGRQCRLNYKRHSYIAATSMIFPFFLVKWMRKDTHTRPHWRQTNRRRGDFHFARDTFKQWLRSFQISFLTSVVRSSLLQPPRWWRWWCWRTSTQPSSCSWSCPSRGGPVGPSLWKWMMDDQLFEWKYLSLEWTIRLREHLM